MKRVLVVRCGALGDLVYATSVIDALKHEYGEETQIDFVSTPSSAAIFTKDPRVNRLFSLKHKKIPLLLSSEKRAIVLASKQNPYDILINFEHGKQFRSLLEAINAKQKVGAQLSNPPIPANITHMVDVIRYTFKELVSKEVFDESFPHLIGSDKNEMRSKYNLKDDCIIISPSNSHQKRNRINYRAWENTHWKTLIEAVAKKKQVVIIGAKGEESFFQQLKPYPKGVVDLVGKTPLSDLIGVIEAASALIATDTGTAHIASAVKTDVYALIGPTPAEVTGPYKHKNNSVEIISLNLECAPCYKTERMKKCKENICMKNITPQMVLDRLKKSGAIE
jgi:ADP-heptose:LPS heptosyltransferase